MFASVRVCVCKFNLYCNCVFVCVWVSVCWQWVKAIMNLVFPFSNTRGGKTETKGNPLLLNLSLFPSSIISLALFSCSSSAEEHGSGKERGWQKDEKRGRKRGGVIKMHGWKKGENNREPNKRTEIQREERITKKRGERSKVRGEKRRSQR